MALTWRGDELVYFLDLRSGAVRQSRRSAFGGDGDDFELTEGPRASGMDIGEISLDYVEAPPDECLRVLDRPAVTGND